MPQPIRSSGFSRLARPWIGALVAVAWSTAITGCAYHNRVSEAEALAARGEYAAALSAYQAAKGSKLQLKGDDLNSRIESVEKAWAQELATEAARLAGADQAGSAEHARAMLLAAQAAQLDPSTDRRALARRLRADYLAAQGYAVVLAPRDEKSAQAALAVEELLPAAGGIKLAVDFAGDTTATRQLAAAETLGGAHDLRVEYFITDPLRNNSTNDRQKIVEVQRGTEKVPNPEYAAQEKRVAAARQQVQQAEKQVELQRDAYILSHADASGALSDNPLDNLDRNAAAPEARMRYDNALQAARRARTNLQRELAKLEDTARQRDQPRMEPYSFPIKVHVISAAAALRATLTGPNAGARELETKLETAESYEEYPAQPEAKLPAQKPKLPTDEELLYELQRQAAETLKQAIVDAAARDAAALLEPSGDPSQQLARYVQFAATSPQKIAAQQAAQVDAFIAAQTGIENATELLRAN